MKAFLRIGNQSIRDLLPLKKPLQLVGAVASPAATTARGSHLLPRTRGTLHYKTRCKTVQSGLEEPFFTPEWALGDSLRFDAEEKETKVPGRALGSSERG